MSGKLALLGGDKTITVPFKPYQPIGAEEAQAAREVIDSGVLSKFIGAWHEDFFGGPKVRQFEQACAEHFGVRHAVTVNSWTSGLIAAVGAIGIEPGDEVIVSPWTMCASATAILHWNAIPVFADIDPVTFCLDPRSVEANISPQTKAIMAVDIFGHPADMDTLMAIARRHGLKVISDSAQAPGARYKGKYAGTLADVGGISLNYHKHIHTGEGGVLFTNDDRIADRLRLIRNHAEAVVGDMGIDDLTNMIGFNFRLGEIECAIGIEQLKKLPALVRGRQRIAEKLTQGLANLPGLRLPAVMPGCTHAYYVYPMVIDSERIGVSRETLAAALSAEGIPGLSTRYQNIHLLPMFQKKIAFGKSGFPWTSEICQRPIKYAKGICPEAETLNDTSYMGLALCAHELTPNEVEEIITAFYKVWAALPVLQSFAAPAETSYAD